MTEQLAEHAATGTIALNGSFWLACSIFSVALILIISEKINKTVVALFGASLVLVLKILVQHEAFHLEEFGVDWNVIFLLIGMMTIINLMRPTGLFEYIAFKSAKMCKGEPVKILVTFSIITALLSALLDNVTTVLLLAPVTLLIADALEIDAIPFLIVEALASNIGGTATLIGDPPNIMIASKAKLSFLDFIIHLTPVVVIMMVVCVFLVKLFFNKRLKTRDELKQRIMNMNEREAIKDPVMLTKSLVVLTIVLLGFIFHGVLHYEPATIALFGAGLLLLLSGTDEPHHVLAEVEWSVIFFFIGLFIMVGGLVKVGAIKMMSQEMLSLTKGDLFSTSMLIMWFSALASAIVDNIPYVATMNPLVIDMARELWPDATGNELLQHPELMPIWWSLALGSCLGGNGTPIGASANVIVVGMAEKAGNKISFMKFMAYGVPVTFLTVLISMIYVWLRYYFFVG
ncbi:MAG: ArsB/NhaD family transporter [Desulfobulbaceae bacterium]|nr:ArsB/NhaD family transporter [Desulfobulbaceae bacterium]